MSDGEIKDALEMAASKEIKDKLKGATQKALDYGVSPANVVITLGDSVEPFNWIFISGCITSAGLWLPPVGAPPEREPRDLFWIGQIRAVGSLHR